MRRKIWCGLLIAGCVVLPDPHTRAQSEITGQVITENGMHRALFRVPEGVLHVNLPDDLSAGDSVSGTVYTEPSGRNPNELARNAGEISGYVVELPGQPAPARDKRFRWNVPATVPEGVVPVGLRNKKNRIVLRGSIPVNPTSPGPPPSGIDLPSGGATGSAVSVWGPFGSPAGASVTIGGRDAPVLAESPRKLVALTPLDVVGPSTIEVRSGPLSASGPLSMLGLQTGVTQRNLLAGQTAVMTAVVSGLEEPREAATLVITNHDPGTVSVAGGPLQQVTITPAQVSANGTFTLTRVLTGVTGGGFNITVAVSRPPSSLVPIERLAGRTVDLWSMAQGVRMSTAARAQIVSDVIAARPQLDVLLTAQIANRGDFGTELDWLVRDYCFTLRDQKLKLAASRPTASPRYALAFAPQPAASRAAVSLEITDVARFSFAQFLAQLLARLTPSDPFGDLVVASQPDRQAIAIDGATAADYLTNRSFVLSVGKHAIRVASCSQTVFVNANQQAILRCSR